MTENNTAHSSSKGAVQYYSRAASADHAYKPVVEALRRLGKLH
jgi:hypothetical protein